LLAKEFQKRYRMIKKNKKTNIVLACLLLVFFGCTKKRIEIIIENSSNISDSINIDVMLDGVVIYKNVSVKRDKEKVRFETLNIDFPENKTDARLNFRMSNTGELTGSIVTKDSIKRKATVHVNFLEVRFSKGFELGTKILSKDSIARREFYSEVIYN
jgi:archaellum component FlaF (FlaF/FlaG flagellin family)